MQTSLILVYFSSGYFAYRFASIIMYTGGNRKFTYLTMVALLNWSSYSEVDIVELTEAWRAGQVPPY